MRASLVKLIVFVCILPKVTAIRSSSPRNDFKPNPSNLDWSSENGLLSSNEGVSIDQKLIILSGRLHCFLCGPPHTLESQSLKPLFSNPTKDQEENSKTKIHAYVDYSLDKKSWYGLRRIGWIVGWKKSWENYMIPSHVHVGTEMELDCAKPATSSGFVYFDWKNGTVERRPSFELRIKQQKRARLSFFLPLFRRFNVHLISNHNMKEENVIFEDDLAFERYRDHNSCWWIPEFKMDPFSSSLTSENKGSVFYRNRYVLNFRLSVRQNMSFSSEWGADSLKNINLQFGLSDIKNGGTASLIRFEAPFGWNIIGSSRVVMVHERKPLKNTR
jgi:hypothetical protein